MTIGEKIKARRKELKMTTEELGRLIGVQRSAITKYEKGHVDLKSKQIQAIAKALEVPPVYLLPDDNPDEEQTLIAAYWNADPVYRKAALDILLSNPMKKDTGSNKTA